MRFRRRDRCRRALTRLASVSLLLCLLCVAQCELLQVQVLHRHGARTHLKKDPSDPADEKSGGAELLAVGREQLEDLGKAIRSRYLVADAVVPLKGARASYQDARDVLAKSSDTERTRSSSSAFLKGLYPDSDGIETDVFDEEDMDWRMRSYTMCPKFSENVQALLDDKETREKAESISSDGTLSRVAEEIGESGELANAFNVYDQYLLSRAQYAGVEALPEISDSDFAVVEDAAFWLESRKYADPNTAARYVSGPLLAELVRHAESMLSDSENTSRVVEYSGHYPLVLGLFAALDFAPTDFKDGERTDHASSSLLGEIPGFGAAFVWELHSGGAMKFVWRAGMGADFITLPCGGGRDDDSCRVEDLAKLARGTDGIASARQFCERCTTGDSNQDLCSSLSKTQESGSADDADIDDGVETSSPQGSRPTRSSARLLGAVIAVLLFASALMYGAFRFASMRRQRAAQRNFEIQPIADL